VAQISSCITSCFDSSVNLSKDKTVLTEGISEMSKGVKLFAYTLVADLRTGIGTNILVSLQYCCHSSLSAYFTSVPKGTPDTKRINKP